MFDINHFHRINIARQHEAFAPAHGPLALVACASEELGEVAQAVLGVEGEKKRKAHLTREDVLKECADVITYVSLLAGHYGCTDLGELLRTRFNTVTERAGSQFYMPGEPSA